MGNGQGHVELQKPRPANKKKKYLLVGYICVQHKRQAVQKPLVDQGFAASHDFLCLFVIDSHAIKTEWDGANSRMYAHRTLVGPELGQVDDSLQDIVPLALLLGQLCLRGLIFFKIKRHL